MKICWNDLTLEEWDATFARVPRSNLLQSWPYAQMMRSVKQMSTRFGRLVEGTETRAIFQIHEVRLTPLYHVVTLDRGPLWLDDNVTEEHWQAFVDLFTAEFPKRFGRRRRFMPELSVHLNADFTTAGFAYKGVGYQSVWLDLSQDTDALRKNLKQKWRNALNQSEKKNLDLRERNGPLSFRWLMEAYNKDRQRKLYQGPSDKVLKSLYGFCRPRDDVMLLVAEQDGAQVAAVLLFLHGTSATYQVGWTGQKGREARAHQRLLWEAVCLLKERGINWLDLGGIHPDQAEGVTKFKRGLGGEEFQLSGVYA
ncbi:GNAT family N-acetyltransferase [Parvularcula sp. IMCC14364]|uniref:lipid II:glycine glycyltransferase FemX n=1 Tax=Parvularcula sp. IMCC14364 TaxID=3067902 RepID=UPI00274109A3|nr:GNAT family N-acetyltransferase [Parvularcula sp. IMCC14364]